MTALKAGARHVTAVERWLYLSSAAQEALIANGFSPDTFSVVYKRHTDLALIRDVPIVCNLLICDIMDEGAAGFRVRSRTQIDKLYLYKSENPIKSNDV